MPFKENVQQRAQRFLRRIHAIPQAAPAPAVPPPEASSTPARPSANDDQQQSFRFEGQFNTEPSGGAPARGFRATGRMWRTRMRERVSHGKLVKKGRERKKGEGGASREGEVVTNWEAQGGEHTVGGGSKGKAKAEGAEAGTSGASQEGKGDADLWDLDSPIEEDIGMREYLEEGRVSRPEREEFARERGDKRGQGKRVSRQGRVGTGDTKLTSSGLDQKKLGFTPGDL